MMASKHTVSMFGLKVSKSFVAALGFSLKINEDMCDGGDDEPRVTIRTNLLFQISILSSGSIVGASGRLSTGSYEHCGSVGSLAAECEGPRSVASR